MNHWQSIIKYPFVYLDSSQALRTKDPQIEKITRKFFYKHPEACKRALEEMKIKSLRDNVYYQKIITLKNLGKISSLITLESFSPFLQIEYPDVVPLFGTIFERDLNNIVFWNDDVDFRTYTRAALLIANAQCVIADAAFFQITVARALQQYIPTACPLIVSSLDTNEKNIEGSYTKCELPSADIIQYLLSVQ